MRSRRATSYPVRRRHSLRSSVLGASQGRSAPWWAARLSSFRDWRRSSRLRSCSSARHRIGSGARERVQERRWPPWRCTPARWRWVAYAVLGGAAAATLGPWLVLVLIGCGAVEITWQIAARGAGAGVHAWPIVAAAVTR